MKGGLAIFWKNKQQYALMKSCNYVSWNKEMEFYCECDGGYMFM